MAEAHPLLDPPPAARGTAESTGGLENSATMSLVAGLLRRWPWLVLGVLIGVVVGIIYHFQRPLVYQSTAQLMVLKNRPELVSGGASDVRVQFVEDYVAGQVILLRSERILRRAADKHLPRLGPFERPLPSQEHARLALLSAGFSVMREKEPGSNIGSNVLALTFKASHALDAPKYLRAIIDAYREELAEVFEDASARQLRQLEEEIAAVEKSIREIAARRAEAERSFLVEDPRTGRLRMPEDLTLLRSRLSANHATQITLRLRQQELQAEWEELQLAEQSRPVRLMLLQRLGVSQERSSILQPDARSPESLLRHLQFRRSELMARYGYGVGHPEIVALDRQLSELEREVQSRGVGAEELLAYRQRLMNERNALDKKLQILAQEIAQDERKLQELTPIHNSIQKANEELQREETRLRELHQLRDQIRRTERGGVFEVKEVTTPTLGVLVSPLWFQSLAVGLMLGLVLGGGLALGWEWADRSFRSPADIRRHLGLSVLGHIPQIRIEEEVEQELTQPLDAVLVTLWRPSSAEAEAVRALRNQVLFSTTGRDHVCVQITSPHPGDGKSVLTANLAVSLALSGKRVALVDCDFRKPRQHRLFALGNPEQGIAAVLAGQAELAAVARPAGVENLTIYPCGTRPDNPAELLTCKHFPEVLAQLQQQYDYVLLDTPPVLSVSDPVAVAARVDEVVLVFRMRRDVRSALERTKQDIQAVGGRILGVVVNALPLRDHPYRYSYYHSGYLYQDSYRDAP
ncbi:polysaccharide biosynthesis tyrosine autokinase [Thermogemmata fonticola]|uniref:non-specific protein-tyrosine kinase n=1 Tax=Thermogemmata fonticola TaxID=2755323 RepID=A0A7V8VGP7_9BACT|nr:polysaccharide biosynthesis tyrosine autokinase [Thermogemmata fonticola]MBA2227606.1 polysaccharide biosynthesis tyrosine autokinase [Thermogemmata fonticola]